MRNITLLTLALAAITFVAPASAQQVGATNTNTIGYPSVAAALTGLRARSDVDIRTQQGWTIITEQGGLILWSFTPPDHPAYPAVVKRSLFQKSGGAWVVETAAKCQAEKAPCDQLVADFIELNEAMRKSLERRQGAGKIGAGRPAARKLGRILL